MTFLSSHRARASWSLFVYERDECYWLPSAEKHNSIVHASTALEAPDHRELMRFSFCHEGSNLEDPVQLHLLLLVSTSVLSYLFTCPIPCGH